jgi:hypothetical protein
MGKPETAEGSDAAGLRDKRNVPKMVRRMLMKKSAPQPRSRKTPTGGRMMARRILQMSLLEVSVHMILLFVHPNSGSLGMTSRSRVWLKRSSLPSSERHVVGWEGEVLLGRCV